MIPFIEGSEVEMVDGIPFAASAIKPNDGDRPFGVDEHPRHIGFIVLAFVDDHDRLTVLGEG